MSDPTPGASAPGSSVGPPSPRQLAEREQAARELLARHLEGAVAAEPYVQAVELDPEIPRWYVRFGCEGRDATTIYFDLHQRTLRYEVYFLPLPAPPHDRLFEFLLRRNHTSYGVHFSVGPDGDLYLSGRVALEHLDEAELDRIIGVIYEMVENWFQPVLRLVRSSASAG